ncbi:MAG TPA: DUF29 family protein [Candidatus Binataceae bacterium]|nr:DUF29 family protein [Candidatus Binataceae bacterium]
MNNPALRVEPHGSMRLVARQVWHGLTASALERQLLTSELNDRIASKWWDIRWQDDLLMVQRQIVRAAAGTAFGSGGRAQRIAGPALGSPRIFCDGDRICVDEEPGDENLLDDVAFVVAKIAKSLGWRNAVASGSQRFTGRFGRYALHESDFCTWAGETAKALRTLRPVGIDWESVAEEVEDLGRSERRSLKSQLHRLLQHLLKWEHQPERRNASWRVSVENARDEIRDLLADSPALRAELPDLMEKAYRLARREACAETGLADSKFPQTCPWTVDRVTDSSFWPEVSPKG